MNEYRKLKHRSVHFYPHFHHFNQNPFLKILKETLCCQGSRQTKTWSYERKGVASLKCLKSLHSFFSPAPKETTSVLEPRVFPFCITWLIKDSKLGERAAMERSHWEKETLFWSSSVGSELFFHRNAIVYVVHSALLQAHYELSSLGWTGICP